MIEIILFLYHSIHLSEKEWLWFNFEAFCFIMPSFIIFLKNKQMAVTGRKDSFCLVRYNYYAKMFLLKCTVCHNFCPAFEAKVIV